jgi:cob(I)alamin adenosyltransferase
MLGVRSSKRPLFADGQEVTLMPGLEQGLVQVYTGNGKGKTTAALGQAFRSVGRGLQVRMIQFLKSNDTGELVTVRRLEPDFQIFRFEKKHGFFWSLTEEEKRELQTDVNKAFDFALRTMTGGCDVLILDEVMGAIDDGLLTAEQVCDLIRRKPPRVELILTGRHTPPAVLQLADLVTEMREVKHYFHQGIPARRGIEN